MEGILRSVADSKDMYMVLSFAFINLKMGWVLQGIVLDSISFGFLKPNILDVELGTVLYDETALPGKVAHREKLARNKASFEMGIRLAGFQVLYSILILLLFLSFFHSCPVSILICDATRPTISDLKLHFQKLLGITSQPVTTPKIYG